MMHEYCMQATRQQPHSLPRITLGSQAMPAAWPVSVSHGCERNSLGGEARLSAESRRAMSRQGHPPPTWPGPLKPVPARRLRPALSLCVHGTAGWSGRGRHGLRPPCCCHGFRPACCPCRPCSQHAAVAVATGHAVNCEVTPWDCMFTVPASPRAFLQTLVALARVGQRTCFCRVGHLGDLGVRRHCVGPFNPHATLL